MESEGCNNGMTPQEQQMEAQQSEGNGCNDGTTPQEQQMEAQQPEGNGWNDGTTPQEQQMEAQQPEGNGCNDGTTPQEQQMEAQQPEGNGWNDGTTPQEQQMEAQQPEGNGWNDGTTPQEQQTEAQEPEGNEEQMYLFSDDESNYIEDESKEDTVQTEELHSKQNFISIQSKIEIEEAAIRGKNYPGFTLHGLAWENNMQGNQIRHYIKSLPELRRLVYKKGGKSTKHSGRPTSVANAKELCEWVVNIRCEGMPISINMVIPRASQMDDRFHWKRMQTKYSVVRQLLQSHSIVIHSKTHQAQ